MTTWMLVILLFGIVCCVVAVNAVRIVREEKEWYERIHGKGSYPGPN